MYVEHLDAEGRAKFDADLLGEIVEKAPDVPKSKGVPQMMAALAATRRA